MFDLTKKFCRIFWLGERTENRLNHWSMSPSIPFRKCAELVIDEGPAGFTLYMILYMSQMKIVTENYIFPIRKQKNITIIVAT